jgi:hypothetical protein
MPTSGYGDEEVKQLYDRLEDMLEEEGKGDTNIIIMGGWNSVVGNKSNGNIFGPYGLGNRNKRGQMLIDFCERTGLVITNTWFKKRKGRLYTWKAPGDQHRYQLDYILVKQRFRNSVKDVQTQPGADIDYDHNLLVAKICTRLKRIMRLQKRKPVWDLEKLQAQRQKAQESLEEKLRAGDYVNRNVGGQWNNSKKCLLYATSDCVGKVEKRTRKPWITQELISKMDEQRKLKCVNNEEGRKNYKRLNNVLRRTTDKAKLEYLESKCDEIMELQRTGRYDLMYRKAKELYRKENNGIRTLGIEDSQGNMIVDQKQVLKIWEVYAEELYEGAYRPENLKVEPEEVDEDHKGPYILLSEVEKAIKEMRDKKVTGD